MKERVLAHYVNAEPAEAVEIFCSHLDYSEARAMGEKQDAPLIPDVYRIRTVFVNGHISIRDCQTREEANDVFRQIIRISAGRWERAS